MRYFATVTTVEKHTCPSNPTAAPDTRGYNDNHGQDQTIEWKVILSILSISIINELRALKKVSYKKKTLVFQKMLKRWLE